MGSFSNSREAKLWVVLSAILVTSAVVAELVSVKLFQVRFYGFIGYDQLFTLTCGSLLWPLVFLTTDAVNEFFGARAVRFATWVTIAMISWTFLVTTASIGVAFSADCLQTPTELLRRADVAMYQAKDRGRSRVERYGVQSTERAGRIGQAGTGGDTTAPG